MFLTEIRMVVWKTSEIIIQTKDTITFLWEDINLFIWEEIALKPNQICLYNYNFSMQMRQDDVKLNIRRLRSGDSVEWRPSEQGFHEFDVKQL